MSEQTFDAGKRKAEFFPDVETYLADTEAYIERLEQELTVFRARADRLARGYIAFAEYTYGTKRGNIFPLLMEYHGRTEVSDFDPVRDEVHSRIATYPDWADPDEGNGA